MGVERVTQISGLRCRESMLEGEVPSHAALDLDLRRPADHMGYHARSDALFCVWGGRPRPLPLILIVICGGTGAPPVQPSEARQTPHRTAPRERAGPSDRASAASRTKTGRVIQVRPRAHAPVPSEPSRIIHRVCW